MRERKHGCFLILHLGGFRGGLEGNYPEFKIPGWLVLHLDHFDMAFFVLDSLQ